MLAEGTTIFAYTHDKGRFLMGQIFQGRFVCYVVGKDITMRLFNSYRGQHFTVVTFLEAEDITEIDLFLGEGQYRISIETMLKFGQVVTMREDEQVFIDKSYWKTIEFYNKPNIETLDPAKRVDIYDKGDKE